MLYLGLISLKNSKLEDADTSSPELAGLMKMIILLFNLGFTKHQLNKKEDAELFYKKSIKIKKTVMALNNFIINLLENNQKTKSINCLKKA